MTSPIGVNLPMNGTPFFLSLLSDAAEAHPSLAPYVEGLNKQTLLGEGLIRFEAARYNLPVEERIRVAETLTQRCADRLLYVDEKERKIPLSEYMTGRADPLQVIRHPIPGGNQDIRRVPFRGRIYEKEALSDIAGLLEEENKGTPEAWGILNRIARRSAIDLSGRRFVMMGGAAALAPTELLLRAGATVLYFDLKPGLQFVSEAAIQGGELVFPEQADITVLPREIVATIEEFSQGEPVDIGCFAYLDQDAMDLRLTATMNAIVRRLDPQIIRSIGMYISPTTPVPSVPEDFLIGTEAYANPTLATHLWRAFLPQIPKIGRPLIQNHYQHGNTFWPRNIVPLQGSTYQIAQYVGKTLPSEIFATRGTRPDQKRPINVSANVLAIARTPSIERSFGPGLKGAPRIRIETYPSETLRPLSGNIYIQQILEGEERLARHPDEDDNERLRRLREIQMHGGLYSHAHGIEGAIVQATLFGLMEDPREVKTLIRMLRSKKK